MTAELAADHIGFQKMLESLYEKNIQNDAIQKFKEKAWLRLQELGLPTRRDEVFQYVRLRSLYSQHFDASKNADVKFADLEHLIFPECKDSVLVIINGHYRSDLSKLSGIPKRIVILPLQEAFRTYGSFLNNQWNKSLKREKDPFALLNAALFQNGLFLYVPPKTVLETPIQILHVSSCHEDAMLIAPRLQGFVGAQSQIDIIAASAHLSGQKLLSTLTTELAIDEDSHVRYMQAPLDVFKQGWYFDAFRVDLKRNSTLKTIMASEGSASMRHDYHVALMGENAEASLNGVWMLSGSHEAHANILMEHQAPHCRSMQLFKSVLSDNSHSSFEGKIYVHSPAQKTEAFQLNNNLLLSDKARADSKPNLEIFADDVKASHGATVGQLDEEQLFYLKTRGFSEEAAKNILVYGFCKEVLDLFPEQLSIAQHVRTHAKKYLVKGV